MLTSQKKISRNETHKLFPFREILTSKDAFAWRLVFANQNPITQFQKNQSYKGIPM